MIGFGQAGKSIQEYTSLNGDSAIECIEHDSLEFTRIMSQRMGVKYKGKPFTGTKCGYFNEDTKRIVSPIVYIEGKIYGYSYDYYENGNKAVETYFENGKVIGKYTMWNEDGTLFKESECGWVNGNHRCVDITNKSKK